MKLIVIVLLLILSIAGSAFAYTESQMNECISSALNNPATKSISEIAITNYCDCAVKAIIDEKKDIRDSGYECALKNFN